MKKTQINKIHKDSTSKYTHWENRFYLKIENC